MSIVNGNFHELTSISMGAHHAIVTFELSAPATQTWDEKRLISADKKCSTPVDPVTGEWVMPVASTESMGQDRWYKVSAVFLNGDDIPIGFDEFPWEIRVPEGVWSFTDLVRDWSNPLSVAITTGVPEHPVSYVLNPETGDFFRRKA